MEFSDPFQSVEKARHLMRLAIIAYNSDVDPITTEYSLVQQDETYALIYHNDATHEFKPLAYFRLVLVAPPRSQSGLVIK